MDQKINEIHTKLSQLFFLTHSEKNEIFKIVKEYNEEWLNWMMELLEQYTKRQEEIIDKKIKDDYSFLETFKVFIKKIFQTIITEQRTRESLNKLKEEENLNNQIITNII